MAQEQTENEKDIMRTEKRTFRYSNDVVFEFDLDVSEPESAVAEITDFLHLMKIATKDLEEIRGDFAGKMKEQKEEEKKDEEKKDAE